MSKKPTLYDLFNDDSLWGNQTAGDLTHNEMLDEAWNKRWHTSRKDKQRKIIQNWVEKNGAEHAKKVSQTNKDKVPNLIAISPAGEKYTFASMQEAEEALGCGPLFLRVPADGMPYKGIRKKKKNWIFYRDIPNKNREEELTRLRKIINDKINPILTQPWRSPNWRKSEEGQLYFKKKKELRKNVKPHKKMVKTPDGIFKTNKLAADYYGITPASFNSRKMHNPTKYYNCDQDGNPV